MRLLLPCPSTPLSLHTPRIRRHQLEAARAIAIAASREKEKEEATQRQSAPKYGEAGYRWHAAIPQVRVVPGYSADTSYQIHFGLSLPRAMFPETQLCSSPLLESIFPETHLRPSLCVSGGQVGLHS